VATSLELGWGGFCFGGDTGPEGGSAVRMSQKPKNGKATQTEGLKVGHSICRITPKSVIIAAKNMESSAKNTVSRRPGCVAKREEGLFDSPLTGFDSLRFIVCVRAKTISGTLWWPYYLMYSREIT
jgi:hypothetical protein